MGIAWADVGFHTQRSLMNNKVPKQQMLSPERFASTPLQVDAPAAQPLAVPAPVAVPGPKVRSKFSTLMEWAIYNYAVAPKVEDGMLSASAGTKITFLRLVIGSPEQLTFMRKGGASIKPLELPTTYAIFKAMEVAGLGKIVSNKSSGVFTHFKVFNVVAKIDESSDDAADKDEQTARWKAKLISFGITLEQYTAAFKARPEAARTSGLGQGDLTKYMYMHETPSDDAPCVDPPAQAPAAAPTADDNAPPAVDNLRPERPDPESGRGKAKVRRGVGFEVPSATEMAMESAAGDEQLEADAAEDLALATAASLAVPGEAGSSTVHHLAAAPAPAQAAPSDGPPSDNRSARHPVQ